MDKRLITMQQMKQRSALSKVSKMIWELMTAMKYTSKKITEKHRIFRAVKIPI